MKTTQMIGDAKDLENKGYKSIIQVFQHKEQKDKQGIIINPDIDNLSLVLGISRLNRLVSNLLNISYDDFLSLLKSGADFDNRYGNLNLSEEQIQKIVDKEIPPFLRRQK